MLTLRIAMVALYFWLQDVPRDYPRRAWADMPLSFDSPCQDNDGCVSPCIGGGR